MAHSSAILEAEPVQFPSLRDLASAGLDERRSCCDSCLSSKMIEGRVVCVNINHVWQTQGHYAGCCSAYKTVWAKRA